MRQLLFSRSNTHESISPIVTHNRVSLAVQCELGMHHKPNVFPQEDFPQNSNLVHGLLALYFPKTDTGMPMRNALLKSCGAILSDSANCSPKLGNNRIVIKIRTI